MAKPRSGYRGVDPQVEAEIARLRELMPASGRMLVEITPQPQQGEAIAATFPYPWRRGLRPVTINFSLWPELPRPQRDLLFLRTVAWLLQVQWFKVDWFQGLTLVGVAGTGFELFQQDAVGVLVAGGLTAVAARQLWRDFRSPQRELDADQEAIAVAQRRGYNVPEAARALGEAIEASAALGGRPHLTAAELMRLQNLKAIRANATTAKP